MKTLLSLLANMVGPWLGYEYLHGRGWTEVQALLAVTVIPLAWGLGALLIQRRWDALAIISAVSMGLSLLVTALSNDVRALQVRDSYLTGLFGVLFLLSVVVRRPVLLWLALSQVPVDRQIELRGHLQHPSARHTFNVLTLGWGLICIAECFAKIWMIEVYSIQTVLAASPWVLNGMAALGMVWTFLYVRYRKNKGGQPEPADLPEGDPEVV